MGVFTKEKLPEGTTRVGFDFKAGKEFDYREVERRDPVGDRSCGAYIPLGAGTGLRMNGGGRCMLYRAVAVKLPVDTRLIVSANTLAVDGVPTDATLYNRRSGDVFNMSTDIRHCACAGVEIVRHDEAQGTATVDVLLVVEVALTVPILAGTAVKGYVDITVEASPDYHAPVPVPVAPKRTLDEALVLIDRLMAEVAELRVAGRAVPITNSGKQSLSSLAEGL